MNSPQSDDHDNLLSEIKIEYNEDLFVEQGENLFNKDVLSSTSAVSNSTSDIMQLLSKINENQINFLEKLDIQNKVIMNMEKKILAISRELSLIKGRIFNSTKTASEDIKFGLLSSLPLLDAESFIDFEESVRHDEEKSQELEQIYIKIGGKDYASFLRNNLKNLLIDSAASSFSWTGQRNNTSVRHYHTIKLLKEICFKLFRSSDSDMDTTIKLHFNRAKDRIKKQEYKMKMSCVSPEPGTSTSSPTHLV